LHHTFGLNARIRKTTDIDRACFPIFLLFLPQILAKSMLQLILPQILSKSMLQLIGTKWEKKKKWVFFCIFFSQDFWHPKFFCVKKKQKNSGEEICCLVEMIC